LGPCHCYGIVKVRETCDIATIPRPSQIRVPAQLQTILVVGVSGLDVLPNTGKWTGEPWQWFGPFNPSKTCRQNVRPSISIKNSNGTNFWMLNAEQDGLFNDFCP